MIKTIPEKKNAKSQNGYLGRPYKYLRKKDKLKAVSVAWVLLQSPQQAWLSHCMDWNIKQYSQVATVSLLPREVDGKDTQGQDTPWEFWIPPQSQVHFILGLGTRFSLERPYNINLDI